MPYPIRLKIIFLISFLGLGSLVWADSTEELLAKIQKETGLIKTLSADFVSVKKVTFFKKPILGQGKLYFSAEGKLRWEISKPSPLALTYDGSKLIHYTLVGPGKWKPMPEQFDPVMVEVMKQLQSWLSGKAFDMNQNYFIAVSSRNPVKLILTPKAIEMRHYLQRLEFTFGKQLNVVRTLLLQEGSGDSMQIEYQNVQVNEILPAGIFQ